jgi:hypothetical protein
MKRNEFDITMVSAASQNHVKSLRNLLLTTVSAMDKIYIFDLGIEPSTVNDLKSEFPTVSFERFPFYKFPSFYDVTRSAGEYAWKPALLEMVLDCVLRTPKDNRRRIMLWVDAGNKLIKDPTELCEYVYKNGIYSPRSQSEVHVWTHPKMLEYFDIGEKDPIRQFPNRNGAIFGFYVDDNEVCELVHQFARYALIKDCIAPIGSSRMNHRQDQSLFTILYYKYLEKHAYMNQEPYYLCFSVHNDCDDPNDKHKLQVYITHGNQSLFEIQIASIIKHVKYNENKVEVVIHGPHALYNEIIEKMKNSIYLSVFMSDKVLTKDIDIDEMSHEWMIAAYDEFTIINHKRIIDQDVLYESSLHEGLKKWRAEETRKAYFGFISLPN